MNLLHKSVFSEEFIVTRRAVQDIAKVIGKVQQIFLPPSSENTLYGLEVWPEGIASQPFTLLPGGKPERILINLQKGTVDWANHTWPIAQIDGMSFHGLLQNVLAERGYGGQIAYPSFSEEEAEYHADYAVHLANLLWWGHGALEVAKKQVGNGAEAVPQLLYPHNFDEAIKWDQSEEQTYTFGFSPGDETIIDPYFYVTADPETKGFVQRPVTSPAYWQSEGFNGAVLRLQDVWEADDVTGRACQFVVQLLGQ